MTDSQKRVAALNDVDLVRMLTLDASLYSAEALETAEARRRGLPIDPAFIPDPSADPGPDPEESVDAGIGEFQSGGRDIVCTQCGGSHFRRRKVLMNTRGLTYLPESRLAEQRRNGAHLQTMQDDSVVRP